MSKNPKLSNCLKSTDLIVFNGDLYHIHVYMVLFLTIAHHESGTRKAISWSVTVFKAKNFPVNLS